MVSDGAEEIVPCIDLHAVSEEGLAFYQTFIERHGGSLVRLSPGCYRMNFPPGTIRRCNPEYPLPPQESFLITFPDGGCITWYRHVKLDGRYERDVLLVALGESEMPLLTGEDLAYLVG